MNFERGHVVTAFTAEAVAEEKVMEDKQGFLMNIDENGLPRISSIYR